MKKVLIAIFLTSAFAQLAFSQIQTAKVTGGEVQGVVTEGISIFKGIPFAAPPVGDLRWKAPAPVQALDRHQKGGCFRARLHASRQLTGEHRAGQRRLPVLECVDARKKAGRKDPGDRLDLRRRLQRRLDQHSYV